MLFSSVESVKCVKSPYKYLALEGGGVKGIVYGGSAAALETAGILSNIVGFSGSSAGSQGAALLAAGFTGEELTKELTNLDFTSLLDLSPGWNPVDNLKGLVDSYGWFRGQVLEDTIDSLIARKTGKRNTTFEELYSLTSKHLRLTATCVSTHRLIWMDHVSFPTMPVAKAVRASSSIPFFYQPVEHEGLLYVDGGCIRNLPHDAFPESKGVLALSLREGGGGEDRVANITSFMDFSASLAETLLFGPDSANSLLFPSDSEDLDMIPVDYGDVNTVDFHLGQSKKFWLIERGYRSVMDHLSTCGRVSSDVASSLPGWLVKYQEEAELLESLEARKSIDEAPIKAKMVDVKKSLDDYAKHVRICMEQHNDGARCAIGGVVEGDLLVHLKVLFELMIQSRFFMGIAATVFVLVALLLVLARIGFRQYRKERRERKRSESKKQN